MVLAVERLFPLASLVWTVIVEVEVPLAVIDVGLALMTDCPALTAPTVPVAVKVTGEPVSPALVAVRVSFPPWCPTSRSGTWRYPRSWW